MIWLPIFIGASPLLSSILMSNDCCCRTPNAGLDAESVSEETSSTLMFDE